MVQRVPRNLQHRGRAEGKLDAGALHHRMVDGGDVGRTVDRGLRPACQQLGHAADVVGMMVSNQDGFQLQAFALQEGDGRRGFARVNHDSAAAMM